MKLTDQELVLLDGKCREEIQKEVDAAKRRLVDKETMPNLSESVAAFVSDVVEYAKKQGKLHLHYTRLAYCSVCGKAQTYAQYKRNSQYHRKGQVDYSKPILFSGVDLADSFIRIEGYASLGCCTACWNTAKPILIEKLQDVKAEICEDITGTAPKWQWNRNRRCKKCGWTGHEGEMKRERTLMGMGTYAAGCPKCDAKNGLFCGEIEVADGFTVTPVEVQSCQKNQSTSQL